MSAKSLLIMIVMIISHLYAAQATLSLRDLSQQLDALSKEITFQSGLSERDTKALQEQALLAKFQSIDGSIEANATDLSTMQNSLTVLVQKFKNKTITKEKALEEFNDIERLFAKFKRTNEGIVYQLKSIAEDDWSALKKTMEKISKDLPKRIRTIFFKISFWGNSYEEKDEIRKKLDAYIRDHFFYTSQQTVITLEKQIAEFKTDLENLK